MNTQLKKAVVLGLLVLGMGWLARDAQAASTDTMTVSVTPNAQYAVTISSAYLGGYNFGLVNLNSTTQSTVAVTVTNSGTIYEYFGIAISNTSGSWVASAVAPTTDTFKMSALLNAGAYPGQGDANFTAIDNTLPATAANKYGQGVSKTPNTAGLNSRSLWMKLEMPFTLNAGGVGAQTMVLSVTGQGA